MAPEIPYNPGEAIPHDDSEPDDLTPENIIQKELEAARAKTPEADRKRIQKMRDDLELTLHELIEVSRQTPMASEMVATLEEIIGELSNNVVSLHVSQGERIYAKTLDALTELADALNKARG